MNEPNVADAVELHLLDQAGAAIAVIGVAEAARQRTLNGGRAIHDGQIEAFRLVDRDGVTVASGSVVPPMRVTAGQVL